MRCQFRGTRLSGASLLLLLASANPARVLKAQAVSIASVTGRVTDEPGASVPGAHIQVTSMDLGTVYIAQSNAEGIYTIASLPIGAYTLQAAFPGFQTYVQSGIVLRVGDNVQINIT